MRPDPPTHISAGWVVCNCRIESELRCPAHPGLASMRVHLQLQHRLRITLFGPSTRRQGPAASHPGTIHPKGGLCRLGTRCKCRMDSFSHARGAPIKPAQCCPIQFGLFFFFFPPKGLKDRRAAPCKAKQFALWLGSGEFAARFPSRRRIKILIVIIIDDV